MNTKIKYAWIGIAFGFMFPIGALILVIIMNHIPLGAGVLLEAHRANPLLYMIDSAPLFLGIFAYIGGVSKAKSEEAQAALQIALDKVNNEQRQIEIMNGQLTSGVMSIQTVHSDLMSNQIHLDSTLQQMISSEVWIKDSIDHSKTALENMVNLQTELGADLEVSSKKMEPFYALIDDTSLALQDIFEEMSVIKTAVQDNAEQISNLSKTTEEVQGTFSIISALQASTTLLALNASIESARAGEAGRGFDVVAKEMKKLSDETSRSLQTSESILADFHFSLAAIFDHNASLQQTILHSSEKMERLKDKVTNYTEQVETLKADQQQLQRQMSSLLGKINDLIAPIEENIKGVNQLESSLKTASAPIEKTKSLVQQLQSVMDAFNGLN